MELIHTSAPRGLKPGSRGFTTVAQTKGMPAWMSESLERLSGYRFVSGAGGPKAEHNPIVYRHARLMRGSESFSVLSRIAPCAADYSGRSNRIAHHLVFDARELVAAGPAWLLERDDLFRSEWNEDPAMLRPRPALPDAEIRAKPCRVWQETCGDAGWAGEVLRRWMKRPDQPLYVRHPSHWNMSRLLDEAAALLSSELRWRLTFQTGVTDDLPAELTCALRCVPELPGFQRSIRGMAPHNTIDLTAPKTLGDSVYVQKARRGEPIEAEASRVANTTRSIVAAPATGEDSDQDLSLNVDANDDAPYDIAPFADSVTNTKLPPTRTPRISRAPEFERRKVRTWIIASGLLGVVAGLLIGIAVGAKLFRPSKTVISHGLAEVAPDLPGEQEGTAALPERAAESVEESPTLTLRKDVPTDYVAHESEPDRETPPQDFAGAVEPRTNTAEVAPDLRDAMSTKPTHASAEKSGIEPVRWTRVEIESSEISEFVFDPAVIAIDDDLTIPREWMLAGALQVAWLANRDGASARLPAWSIERNAIVKNSPNPFGDAAPAKRPEPAIELMAKIAPNVPELRVSIRELSNAGVFAKLPGFCLRHPSEKRARLLLWGDPSPGQIKLGKEGADDRDDIVFTCSGQPIAHWIPGRNGDWTYEVRSKDRDSRIRVARHKGSSPAGPALIASFPDDRGWNRQIRITVASAIATAKPGKLEKPFLVALHAALQPAIGDEPPKRSIIIPNVYGVPMIELIFPEPETTSAKEDDSNDSGSSETKVGGA